MKVALGDVEAGMVLREPAVNHQGQVLLPKGASIAEKHLRILKTWGVLTVDVEGDEDPAPSVDSGEEAERLRARYRRVADDPVQKRILAVLLQRAGGGT